MSLQQTNQAIVDNKLCSRCTNATHDKYMLVFIAEQTLVETDAVVLAFMLSSRIHTRAHKVLREDMTSSTKWEIHHTLQCCQNTKPPKNSTCKKIGKICLYGIETTHVDKHTNRQTDILIATLCTLAGLSNNTNGLHRQE